MLLGKEADLGAPEDVGGASLPVSGAQGEGPGPLGSSLLCPVWLELKAVKTIKLHPNAQSDMGTPRTWNCQELMCWFLGLANANSVFKT